jgi:uncharacterized Zn-binding protein involved in type VI secretion
MMPAVPNAAARVGDEIGHVPGTSDGKISPPGVLNVLIEGQHAAVMGGSVACTFRKVTPGPPDGPQPLVGGSATVKIGGANAIRVGDKASCGALVLGGAQRVVIGG